MIELNVIKLIRKHIDGMYADETGAPFNIYIVWSNYTLGNRKFLVATDRSDGLYFEVTYNVNKNEWYVDTYKKVQNETFSNEAVLMFDGEA